MPVAPHNVPLVEGVYRFHTRVCDALRSRDGDTARETLVDHIRSSRKERLDIHERIVADAQYGGGTVTLPANLQAELDDLCQRFSADEPETAWEDGTRPE